MSDSAIWGQFGSFNLQTDDWSPTRKLSGPNKTAQSFDCTCEMRPTVGPLGWMGKVRIGNPILGEIGQKTISA